MQKTNKLSRKISALILIGTIAAVTVIGISAYLFSTATLSESIKQNQLEIARQTMNEIDRMLYERLMDIQAIAGEDLLKEILSNISGQIDSDTTNVKEVNERMKELRIQTGPWDRLLIMDSNGNIILSTSEETKSIQENPDVKTAYEKAKAGEMYYSDLVLSPSTGRPNIIFAAPIVVKKEAKREILGVIIGNFSWRSVLQILEDLQSHAILLDREGTVIADNSTREKSHILFRNFKDKPVFQKLAQGHPISLVLSKTETIVSEQTLVSLFPQSGYLSYKGNGWGLIVRTPATVAFQPAARTAVNLVFLLILLLVLTSSVFWIAIIKLVTDPIADLTATIHAITAGDMNQKANVASDDEIGELADSFNIMTAKLKESHESLEEKVKQRTIELEESKEWFSTTLQSIGDAVIATNAEGRVTFLNPIAENMTGWNQEEAKGHILKDVFHIVNEDTRKEVESPVDRVLREGIIVGLANHTILINKQGKEIPLHDSGAPIRNKNGQIVGVVMVFQDVTGRREVERALRESEERHRLTVETANDAFIGMDQKGLIADWNHQAELTFGWQRSEVLGRLLAKTIIPERYQAMHVKGIETFLVTGKGPVLNKRIEISALHKDGHEFPVELTVWPIQLGNTYKFNAFLRDITERKNAEREIEEDHKKIQSANQELAASEKVLRATVDELKQTQSQLIQSDRLAAIGQLAAGVAHEINNPIGYILGNLTALGRYVSNFTEIFRAHERLKTLILEGKEVQKAVQYVHELSELEKKLNMDVILQDTDALLRESESGIDRIVNIIDDLKTFARADNKVVEPTNLNEILQSVINIVWNELKYKAELKKELGEIPLVKCIGQQMGQVFMNMLINAAQAIPNKGIITVKTYAKGKYVCVEISDTGTGISKEVINKIYDPFFTTKEVGKGTGLGLSISYDIIKKHQGKIDVESEIGKGTKFTVLLPGE